MGFFSWECNHCGRAVLSKEATEPNTYIEKAWCTVRAQQSEDHEPVYGFYDGYGRVEAGERGTISVKPDGLGDPCFYHQRCWGKAGTPTKFKASRSAENQGFFINEADFEGFPGEKSDAD